MSEPFLKGQVTSSYWQVCVSEDSKVLEFLPPLSTPGENNPPLPPTLLPCRPLCVFSSLPLIQLILCPPRSDDSDSSLSEVLRYTRKSAARFPGARCPRPPLRLPRVPLPRMCPCPALPDLFLPHRFLPPGWLRGLCTRLAGAGGLGRGVQSLVAGPVPFPFVTGEGGAAHGHSGLGLGLSSAEGTGAWETRKARGLREQRGAGPRWGVSVPVSTSL